MSKSQRGKSRKRPSHWHGTYDDTEVAEIYDNWPLPPSEDPEIYTNAAPEKVLKGHSQNRRGYALS